MDLNWQILAQVFSLIVGLVSYQRKSITISGLLALLIISGLYIWLNQVMLLIIVYAMFASSTLLTKYRKNDKTEFKSINEKNGPRDYIQAIANLGPATLFMLLYYSFSKEYWLAGFLGSVAAANADSWASEIGGLSKQKPVMITTFKQVNKGVSGGITFLGIIGGIIGSLFIVFLFQFVQVTFQVSLVSNVVLFAAVFGGLFGFLLDSFIGALSQALYISDTGEFKEFSNAKVRKVKGISWMNNDVVNFISTFATGLLSTCWAYFI